MASTTRSNDIDARFGHLLKPIRDLTKNWNVDIATQLEDYLEEIASIGVSFDDGATTLNFAEAALLIQGSACVYSRKVEFLHSLVYQVLDIIASKKKLQAASTNAEDGDQNATAADMNQEEQYLSLDDISGSKNVDLKSDTGYDSKGVQALPHVTLSLIPLEEGEKGDNPLPSRSGEVLGNRKDFMMNTCNIHPSGSLLLDLSHLDLLDLSFQNKVTSTPFVPRTAHPMEAANAVGVDDMDVDEGVAANESFDDNEGHADFPPAAPDYEPNDIPFAAENEETVMQDRMRLRTRQPREKIAEKQWQNKVEDYWKLQDPHEDHNKMKEFRRKKTYRLPKSAESQNSRKRKREGQTTAADNRETLEPITTFCNREFFSKQSYAPKNKLKLVLYPELEARYWAEFQSRQNRRRKEKRHMEQEAALAAEDEEEGLEDDQAQDFGGPEDDDNVEPLGPIEFPLLHDDGDNLGGLNLDHIPDPLEEMDGEDKLPESNCYEDYVRHHVEKYLESAQKYAHITELARRVSEWEERLLPALEEENTHDAFDIHKYGTTVLDSLTLNSSPQPDDPSCSEKISFRQVCQNQSRYRVSRLFLATLQLANNYNVEISCRGTLEEAVDTMALRFLSDRRHFEELQEYTAPSLDQ